MSRGSLRMDLWVDCNTQVMIWFVLSFKGLFGFQFFLLPHHLYHIYSPQNERNRYVSLKGGKQGTEKLRALINNVKTLKIEHKG